jgi:MYXO-CTERM domain-containing protein
MTRALLLASLLLPSQAFALSCLWGFEGATSPPSGAVDVPVNTRVVAGYVGLEDPVVALWDEDGNAIDVSFEDTRVAGAGHVVLVPVQPLAPNASYQVVHLNTFGDGTTEQFVFSTFETGDRVDDEAPTTAGLLDVDRQRGSDEWGKTDGYSLTLPDPASEGAAHHEIEVTDVDGTVTTHVAHFGRFFLGEGICVHTLKMESAGYDLRVRAVDNAGNASEWVAWDKQLSGGCSSTGAGASTLLGLLGLGLVRRRREG